MRKGSRGAVVRARREGRAAGRNTAARPVRNDDQIEATGMRPVTAALVEAGVRAEPCSLYGAALRYFLTWVDVTNPPTSMIPVYGFAEPTFAPAA